MILIRPHVSFLQFIVSKRPNEYRKYIKSGFQIYLCLWLFFYRTNHKYILSADGATWRWATMLQPFFSPHEGLSQLKPNIKLYHFKICTSIFCVLNSIWTMWTTDYVNQDYNMNQDNVNHLMRLSNILENTQKKVLLKILMYS